MAPSKVLKARSNVGNATRAGDPIAVAEARRDLAAAKIEQYIARTIADAPALSPDQKAHLAALLRGGAK